MRGLVAGLTVGALAMSSAACDSESPARETGPESSSGVTLGAPIDESGSNAPAGSVDTTSSTSSTAAVVTATTNVPSPTLQVVPYGARSEFESFRVAARDVRSASDAEFVGDVVLTYELELGFSAEGRSGTVVAPDSTSDGQLAIEVGCVVTGCLDFVPVNDFRQTSITITASRTDEDLLQGSHDAPFVLRFDDGTEEDFDVVLWANPGPSPDISDAVIASTGSPKLVQTVFTEQSFAYHAISAFGSVWVLNKNSGTVSRIGAISGELLATIPVREPPFGGTLNRLTATDDAVYVTASPAVKIEPNTNEATEIAGDVDATGIIANNDTVWAGGLRGPIVRIDPDDTITELLSTGRWVDLAFSNGLVWAVEQVRDGGRLIAFDGTTGAIRHDLVVGTDINGFAVRLVADDASVVVGLDTSGGGGRTGQLVLVDPTSGAITDTVTLDSRPEGIVLTPNHIWTSGAVLDRQTLQILETNLFGFTITQGPDGSIWGTAGIPSSHTGEFIVNRYTPGDLRG